MSLKKFFISCLAAVSTTACMTPPVAPPLKDYTVTDPKTGCRYLPDPEHPDKPQPCINRDFP